MALHRDIYWVGKQWAVTGHGVQACNQKQRSQFDIEGSKLWEDGVQAAVRAEKWVDTEDFEKAVAVARKYYPESPEKALLTEETVSSPKFSPTSEVRHEPVAPEFDLRIERVAVRWLPVWRVRKDKP